MKHLRAFEHFSQSEKDHYTQIISTKDELENSDAFSEMPENEQEILSNAYSEESETIETSTNESFDIKAEQLEKIEEYCRLRGKIGNELRELGFGFRIHKVDNESYTINKLTESVHSMDASRKYDKIHKLLADYFKASVDERIACRTYNKL